MWDLWALTVQKKHNLMVFNSPDAKMWCAVTEERIGRPYFVENLNDTRERYRHMLIRYAFPRFRHLLEVYVFQQDKAPSHYANVVTVNLTSKGLKNWMKRGGPVACPPRSSDLTPHNLVLLRHLKSKIYSTSADFVEERVREVAVDVCGLREENLKNVRDETKLRLYIIQRE